MTKPTIGRNWYRYAIAATALLVTAGAVRAADDDGFIVTVESDRGLCLDVDRHSQEKGANLIVYRCHGKDNQRFDLRSAGADRDGDWFSAESVDSGLCLDIKGESKARGAALIQWTCKNTDNQRFDFRPASRWGNVGEIRVKHSNLCLDAGSDKSGTKVTQASCTGSAQQQWTILN
jgi:galactose oxidase